ncbi:MAG: acetolactate synthase large subunit, partial [Flammeovirgaceae bacterium]|nr:acetolactate synthase large subunit [Flammeovirgaceae bacterium]
MNTSTLVLEKKRSKKTTKIKGSDAVLQCLIAEGVTTIFGYPGGAIMPIYDALFNYQDKLNHILTRHEQGAVHAAQGMARVTGKAGVCFATSGPGATNLITGIADAQIDSTPLVCIT